MIVFHDLRNFTEDKFHLEDELEKTVIEHHKMFFGEKTIFIDAKRKIESQSLGAAIPDGFLFNMSDPDNPDFYLVEVELVDHDFYKHIFPQITKFFAFFKNSIRQKELVEKLFSTINTDSLLKKQFKKYLGEQEIFKFLNDIVDSSQNILIVIDGDKPELPEILDTYTDTWGRMVKVLTIKKYRNKEELLYTVDPEFETIEFKYESPLSEESIPEVTISEEFHLENVQDNVKEIYETIKNQIQAEDESFLFNTQKYYISIKGPKNIVFIKFRKKKIRLVVMLPEDEIRNRIMRHSVKTLSESVQRFYNGPCAAIEIVDTIDIDEVIGLIVDLMQHVTTECE